jgi:flagellar hook-length control protein FliK
MLAQTSAPPAKPPSIADRAAKSHNAVTKQAAAAVAQTTTNAKSAKTSSEGSKQPSPPSSHTVESIPQTQEGPSMPLRGGMQTGPVFSATGPTIPDQNTDGADDSDSAPETAWQDGGKIAGEESAPTSTPDKSRASDTDAESPTESPSDLQTDASGFTNSNAAQQTLAPALKNAALSQLVARSPSDSQFNALMQSSQHSTHRMASEQSSTAQPSAPQTDPSAGKQAAGSQAQSNDSGNSNSGHSRGEQAQGSSDNGSSQTAAKSEDLATAVALPPSPAGANSVANSTADAGGISAAIGSQNSVAGSNAVIHVAPSAQATTQTAQPDINTLAISIAAKSQAGSKQFDISLEPAELGRVEVRLTVDTSGKAQAHLVAERPETLQMLQRDSGTLSRALKDSGVQLSDNGLQFSLRGQERQGDGAQQGASRAKPLSITAISTAEPILPIASTYGLALSRAGIDIRV